MKTLRGLRTTQSKDRAERAIRAWTSALYSAMIAQLVNTYVEMPWWMRALMIATGTAAGSFAWSLGAKHFGEPDTASFLKDVEYKTERK